MNNNFRLEEYYPGGSFLFKSFERDRSELMGRFSGFTPEYLAGFDSKLAAVKKLEQSVVLTEEQKDATEALYAEAAALNNELNFLSFYFKKAKLDSAIVSAVKKDLAKGNIEGATDKIEGVIQFIIVKKDLLTAQGMAAGFPDELGVTRDALEAKNKLQNEKLNALNTLHDDNKGVYKELHGYISTVSEAGKIMYKGKVKAGEYTISKIISRMRSGNSGGATPPKV